LIWTLTSLWALSSSHKDLEIGIGNKMSCNLFLYNGNRHTVLQVSYSNRGLGCDQGAACARRSLALPRGGASAAARSGPRVSAVHWAPHLP
jgi:hypothetical protein